MNNLSSSSPEYVLFFSNLDSYSMEVISHITRKNIRNAFVFVCVDSVRPLPPFVDCVPLISSKVTKKIYVDDQIIPLLNQITATMYPPVTIEAVPAFGFGSAMDTEFESLVQGGMPAPGQDSYSMLDMNQFRISFVAEDDDLKSKKTDSSQLEQFIAQRDTDVKILSDRPNLH